MSNKLYNEQMQNQNNNNPVAQYNNFRSNPMQFLMGRGLNIPPQFANDPKGAVQYLVTNGMMSQNTLNGLMQKAQMMGIKF